MEFTTIEGTLIGFAILVVAICLWLIIKSFKGKKVEQTSVDEFTSTQEQETQVQDEDPVACASCRREITGKVKTIKGDTEKTKLCKRCYRSLIKGKMPTFEEIE